MNTDGLTLIKVWQVLGELTEHEVRWLFDNQYDVHIERNEIHFTTLTNSHSRVTMPDVTKIIVRTYGDTAETMFCMKFNNKIRLFNQIWESNFYGGEIEF